MAKTATGLSRTSSDSWPSVVPPWCSSRTCLPGFVADGFDQSERDYADWVTHSKNRSLSLRKRLARATSGSGSSSWPTVRSHEVGDYQNQTDGTTQPTLCGIAHQWPTPAGSVAQDGEQPESWLERRERLKETANNGNGAGMPLTIASQLWPSPRSEGSESCGNHPGATDSLTGACKAMWTTPDTARRGTERPETRYGRNKGKAGAASLLTEAEHLWATPRGQEDNCSKEATDARAARARAKYEAGEYGSNSGPPSMESLNYQSQAWPTPNARDHKGTDLESRNGGTSLGHAVQTGEFSHRDRGPTGEPSPNTSGRRLNPIFVSWLMGSPWWWTRPEPMPFAVAEIQSYRSKLRWHLSNLLGKPD
jgi:hypothetical protein